MDKMMKQISYIRQHNTSACRSVIKFFFTFIYCNAVDTLAQIMLWLFIYKNAQCSFTAYFER